MTRASIILESNSGNRCFYVHCDGYPAHMVEYLTGIIKETGTDQEILGEMLESICDDEIEHPAADSDFIYVINTYKRILMTRDARWDIGDPHGLLRVDVI